MAKGAAKSEPKLPSVPSSESVDAYKKYLQKSMPKYSAKDFAAGAMIPVDQVDKDILILENQISQYQKFGFPTEDKEKNLEVLKGYKTKVKGKFWPGTKTELQQSSCPHTSTTTHITATNVKMAHCLSCAKTWQAPLSQQPLPKKSNYYDKQFFEGIKAGLKYHPIQQMPTDMLKPAMPSSQAITLRAGKAEIDQKLIMRIGMASNCNVSIARVYVQYAYGQETALRCDKCEETARIPDSVFVAKESGLPAKIEEFCKAHRHDAKADESTGRMFRED